ncbi:hypothetical protein EDD86DRAFT_186383 [Gorgonomyces haynaldii]|nr:hypothetical protein EDD86DRAFT_186383 [Gorgonomyces haynaldii]
MDKLSLTHSYLKPPTFTRQERVLTKYQISDETRQWLKEPTFNNWLWEDNELAELVCQMYVDLELTKIFDIPHKTLKSFVNVCKSSYNVTPFHNFKHAFMVTQMCYTIIHFTGLVDKMTPLEKLSMLTACLGHDLNHPGYNNAYQINADTELALIYNDQAVLENHHASMLFCILSHDQSNITANLDGQQKRQFRKLVLKCILATDMSKHGEIVNGFKKIAPEFKYEDEAHRHELFSMLIKCSDISTEGIIPPHVAERWVDLLLEEFFSQSDREKHEGLPTMPFMDREKVTKPSAQIGFIQFVMIPLYETLGMVLQMGPLIEPIRNALQYYKDLQQAAKDAQAK